MSERETKAKAEDQTTAETVGFADICRSMMGGDLPDCCPKPTENNPPGEASGCCGPEMQSKMSKVMAAFRDQA